MAIHHSHVPTKSINRAYSDALALAARASPLNVRDLVHEDAKGLQFLFVALVEFPGPLRGLRLRRSGGRVAQRESTTLTW